MKFIFTLFLMITAIAFNGAEGLSRLRPTCKTIKEQHPDASSGTYTIVTNSGKSLQVYCEMGLNGGGYTFLHPTTLSSVNDLSLSLHPTTLSVIDDLDISQMFTDNTTFLLRARLTDGTQPYAVLKQLLEFSNVPLKISISNCESFGCPDNALYIGPPYIFFGFLPNSVASVAETQGLEVNGVRVSYTHCGVGTASHFALFPNFKEADPGNAYYPDPVYAGIFSNVRDNPSGRVMPSDYFMFGEIHFAECGCYVQTNQMKKDNGVLALTIGFR